MVFPKMFPPGKPAQIPFIDKYIRAVLIFSPSKSWKSIFLLWQSQTQTTEELPCSCTHTLLLNLIITETINYQSTASLWNELKELWACKELCVKEQKLWHTGTYNLLFTISSGFKTKRTVSEWNINSAGLVKERWNIHPSDKQILKGKTCIKTGVQKHGLNVHFELQHSSVHCNIGVRMHTVHLS